MTRVERHTPLALAKLAAERFEREGIENARLDAELLLAHVLGLRRLDLYLQFERPLEPDEVERYRDACRRRLRREPLQYITGEAAFRELVLRVDPRVLIPRPETELLVGEVLKWANGRAARALDVGTGSGAIALSLAREGGFAQVVATDRSEAALALAAENVRRCGLQDRVELRSGALWSALAPGERFDVVVSNPPYIAASERASLAPEVAEWEPADALFAGDDGLSLLDALVAGAPARLELGGLLALEVGAGQAPRVLERIRASGAYRAPRAVRDLAGHERIVLAETERSGVNPGSRGTG